MFGLSSKDIELISKAISSHLDVDEALIFGSRAMGNFKPGSDVDIALKGNLSPRTLSDIYAELNEHLPLPYMFDVLSYSEITHLPLKEHIDLRGKILFKRLTAP